MGKTRSLGLLYRTDKATNTTQQKKTTDSTVTPKTMQMDGSLQLVECCLSSNRKEDGDDNANKTDIRHFN